MSVRYPPDKIIDRNAIDTLWGNGWTIAPVRPHPDPYHIPPEIIPRDRAYQWVSREHDYKFYKATDWRDVPAERHPGMFAPWGYQGPCIIGDLILVEKPRREVDAAHAANHAKAHRNADWANKAAGSRFFGHTAVGGEERSTVTSIDTDEPSQIELPVEMLQHLSAILKERDRLVAEAHKAHLNDEQALREGPFDLLACRVRCMTQAIENIRVKLKAEAAEKDPGDEHADR
jgi:hypothetical protein